MLFSKGWGLSLASRPSGLSRAVWIGILLLLILTAWAGVLWLEVVSYRWPQEGLRGVTALDVLAEELLTGEGQRAGGTGGSWASVLLKEEAFGQVAGLPR